MSTHLSERQVPAAHPCLAGHFPGRPIVPGVLLLDQVHQAVCAAVGPVRILKIPFVKFSSPLQPDEHMRIEMELSSTTASFRCIAGQRLLAQGTLEFAP